ncbi:MAG: CPBP family intramembrane metalloprotease [Spirochaetaceae bacterium]|nr:MAG: CPBP family intramembrane metalloprotease [Spirochaetaceae bacterium]
MGLELAVRRVEGQPDAFPSAMPLGIYFFMHFLGLVSLVCNIFGEEFIWRGTLLPRREIAFGQWAFLVHGLFWAVFHVPVYWMIIPILPRAIALAFVCQRTKSIWPGIIGHLSLNLMGNVETWLKIFS